MAKRDDPQRGTVSGLKASGRTRPTMRTGTRYSHANGRGHGRPLVFTLVLAAVVLLGIIAFAGPVLGGVATGWARGLAEGNPDALHLPFVRDAMRNDLEKAIREPSGTDTTPVEFEVETGATVAEVGDRLVEEDLISDRLAYEYLVIETDFGEKLQAGTYTLNQTMTPETIVETLSEPAVARQTVTVALREGLRLEQIVGYLQTLTLQTDIEEFYDLAQHPTAELREEFPFLSTLPEGRSLEGYLGSGTFEVYEDTTAEDLVRMLLEQWGRQVPQELIDAAEAQDRNFYEVLTLASVVEREAGVPEEAPLIAGVYVNRVMALDPPLMNADPTVFYAYDTAQLRELPLEEWPNYAFWTIPDAPLSELQVPEDLQGYQTYQTRGMIPGPICTPTRTSIEGALEPDTDSGYFYFLLIPDSREHVFAKTLDEHNANKREYGYE
jgi:UPF0755 protein